MKTVILDSSPSIPLHIPSNISLNVSPPYTGHSKKRGQPLLGQRQSHYTHFVPMGHKSEHIKELLGIKQTDTTETKPIEPYKEALKAEKVEQGDGKNSSSEPPFDSSFEQEAKDYVAAPNTYKEDTFQVSDQEVTPSITAKNDAETATLVAATQPKASSTRKTPKQRKKKNMKKNAKKTKKMTKLRIMRKKK